MKREYRNLDQDRLFKTIIERSKTIIFLWRYEEGWPLEMLSENITMFGYTHEEFLNGAMSWYSFIFNEDAEKADREFNEYVGSGMENEEYVQTYRIVTKEGKIRWVSDSTMAIRNNEGMITHVQGIVTDITEEKRLQEELTKYREELELLVQKRTGELEIQKAEVEQKNIALNEILAQIEMKNKQIRKDILFNVNKLLLPLIKTLKKKAEYLETGYINLIESTIKDLSTSFARDLSEEGIGLTPREIEICNMIKNNMSSKEISDLLFISVKSVEWHRYNIRRKFGILNKKENLTTYLKSI